MSAVERLAAAVLAVDDLDPDSLASVKYDDAAAVAVARDLTVVDEWLAMDLEDGRALRELRDALPGATVTVGPGWTQRDTAVFVMTVSVALAERVPMRKARRFTREWGEGSNIAEAADACRVALVKA